MSSVCVGYKIETCREWEEATTVNDVVVVVQASEYLGYARLLACGVELSVCPPPRIHFTCACRRRPRAGRRRHRFSAPVYRVGGDLEAEDGTSRHVCCTIMQLSLISERFEAFWNGLALGTVIFATESIYIHPYPRRLWRNTVLRAGRMGG